MLGIFNKKKKTQNPTTYFNLEVKSIDESVNNVKVVYFELPADITYESGQFITLIFNIDGQEYRRSYSFCTAPDDEFIGVAVKRVKGGVVSNYINDTVDIGSILKAMKPQGRFVLGDKKYNHAFFVAAGSGITPIMALLKSTIQKHPNQKQTLLYANSDKDSIMFKTEVDILAQEQTSLSLTHVLSDTKNADFAKKGRLTTSLFDTIVNDRLSDTPLPAGSVGFWICGPKALMEMVKSHLIAKGVPEEDIHTESFYGQAKSEKVAATGQDQVIEHREYDVTFLFDDKTHKVSVRHGHSLLEAGLDAGLDLPYSCESGVCGACRGLCKSGKVGMEQQEALTQQEIDKGYVLTCIGKALSDDITIEAGV